MPMPLVENLCYLCDGLLNLPKDFWRYLLAEVYSADLSCEGRVQRYDLDRGTVVLPVRHDERMAFWKMVVRALLPPTFLPSSGGAMSSTMRRYLELPRVNDKLMQPRVPRYTRRH